MGKFKIPSIKEIEQETGQPETTGERFRVGSGLLSDVSKGSVLMKITNVPRGKIEKNPNNKYSISGIPSLAESIKQYGLVQPLHVAPEEGGKYLLLGGERRLTAIDLLIKDPAAEEWTEDTLIPCIIKGIDDVKLDLSPENKERYAIITTNKEGRVYTDGDTYMEIQEWKKIINELREKGIESISQYDDDGNESRIPVQGEKTRDILTRAVGISRGQVNKFETVSNKGSEGLKNALLDGKISVSVAEKAARELPPEAQEKIAAAAEQGEKITTASLASPAVQEDRKGSKTITMEGFREDIKGITSRLEEKEILLDGMDAEKYYFYIKKINELLGGHK